VSHSPSVRHSNTSVCKAIDAACASASLGENKLNHSSFITYRGTSSSPPLPRSGVASNRHLRSRAQPSARATATQADETVWDGPFQFPVRSCARGVHQHSITPPLRGCSTRHGSGPKCHGLSRVVSRVARQKRPVFIELSRCHGSVRGDAQTCPMTRVQSQGDLRTIGIEALNHDKP
jgi:hypothetical protein